MKVLFTSPIPTVLYGLSPALAEFGVEVYITDIKSGQQQDPSFLSALLSEYRPDYVFTAGGWDIDDQFLAALSQSRIPHIFWAFDDPLLFKIHSLGYARESQYIFTTASECIAQYNKYGINAHLLSFGCLPSFHHRVPPSDHLTHDCVLVGNNYDSFRSRLRGVDIILKPLIEKGYDIKIYGNSWWLDRARPFFIGDHLYGGYLDYEMMRVAYSSARIVLGIHSVDTSPTMMSMRAYEALGCGAFFLTQWTPSVENTFKNHEHLVWSKSPEETIELTNYYLSNHEKRERIARCGQAEVYAKHTYQHRARGILGVLKASPDSMCRRSWICSWSGDGAKMLRSMTIKTDSQNTIE